MNNFCQIWDEETACSHNSLPCNCENAKHWECMDCCHCLECCENPSSNQGSASEYNTNCCYCENCQHFHNNEYAEQSGFEFDAYHPISNEYDLNKQQSQYLYGNYDYQTRRNFPIDSFSERTHPSMYKNKYNAYYSANMQSNSFANTYSNVRNEHDQTCNATCLSKNNVESNQASLDCGIRVTKSKSDSEINNESNTSDTLTKQSFHTCAPCDSNQIQMMYRNNKQGMSKSTINQSSIQTIASRPSKPTVKRTVLDNKHRRKVINSGYFEFISPTHSPSRVISETTSANPSKQHCASTPTSSSKNDLRCGYFEIKERNYADNGKHQSKKVSFSELDRIPTKISKEVDTSHLKQSTMMDKCLSANINHTAVKTSDKSLSANILTKDWMMSVSEVLKVLNKIPKHRLHPKRSPKVLESISTKSLTHFKSVLSNKSSITKQKDSKLYIRKKLNTTKSFSEGSIKVGKQVPEKIYSRNQSINAIREKGVGYKNYLDNALDKLEIQISNKIERALFTYADISNKKQLLHDYNNEFENSVKILPINETTCKVESLRNGIGINASPTMQTLEDMIDSEEVEIDTNDFEERSSLSSHSNSNENKMYNSDVSSHNTEKTYIVDSTEKSQENEAFIEFERIQNNSTTKKNEIRNSNVSVEKNSIYKEGTTCKFAIVSPSNYHEHNLKRNSYESSNQKFGNRNWLSNSKSKDSNKSIISANKKSINSKSKCSNKSVTSGNQESSDRPCFSSCEQLSQQLSRDTLRKTNCSRSSASNRNQHSLPSHKQGFDSKVRGSRNKNIKFKQPPLGTIEEESYLNMIHEDHRSVPTSETALFNGEDSTQDIRDDYMDNNTHNSFSNHNIYDSSMSKISKVSQRTVSKSNNNSKCSRNISDQVCSKSDYLKSVRTSPEYPVDINLYENDSCCVRQACRDCPKQRYYAEVLQSYNERRIQHYNENQNENQLYKDMLNVPLFDDNCRRIKNQHYPDNKQTKLLNIISFIIFIIMFYGIFHYINVSIHTGTFPWI